MTGMFAYYEWKGDAVETIHPRVQTNSLNSLMASTVTNRHADGVRWVITDPAGCLLRQSGPGAARAWRAKAESK